MSRLSLLGLLGCAVLATGCLAFAAGAAGGAAASQDSDIERYVETHDVEPRIAEAMYDREIVQGMTKEEARLVVTNQGYTSCDKDSTSTEATWSCENPDPKFIGEWIVEFENDEVVTAGKSWED